MFLEDVFLKNAPKDAGLLPPAPPWAPFGPFFGPTFLLLALGVVIGLDANNDGIPEFGATLAGLNRLASVPLEKSIAFHAALSLVLVAAMAVVPEFQPSPKRGWASP